MSVGMLRKLLAQLPQDAEAVLYLDVAGNVESPFEWREERVYVCGYYDIAAMEVDGNSAVLLAGVEVVL